ncbi:hypothetical protein A6A27_36120 [Micromonospora sp. CB01531]|nr:hypothetical protein A6A27_36120 [Micromonospora sp. CB01531]
MFALVCQEICDALPYVEQGSIAGDISMRDLGANSLERMDVVVCSSHRLNIIVTADRLRDVDTIDGLVDVLWAAVQETA